MVRDNAGNKQSPAIIPDGLASRTLAMNRYMWHMTLTNVYEPSCGCFGVATVRCGRRGAKAATFVASRRHITLPICLMSKRFQYTPAHLDIMCRTLSVAYYPAALGRNPLMDKASPLLGTVWHGMCFLLAIRAVWPVWRFGKNLLSEQIGVNIILTKAQIFLRQRASCPGSRFVGLRPNTTAPSTRDLGVTSNDYAERKHYRMPPCLSLGQTRNLLGHLLLTALIAWGGGVLSKKGDPMKIALITMPWQALDRPSLALGILHKRVQACQETHEVFEVYGNLRWAEYLYARSE